MLGTKIYKKDFNSKDYATAAKWANDNNAFIDDCGEYYEVKAIPAQSFKELKAAKLEELKTLKHSFDDQLVNTDMVITSALGFKANADLRSQNNINGLLSVLPDGAATTYRDAENKTHSLTREQLQQLYSECILNGQQLYTQAWQKEQAINSAKTTKELEAISLDFAQADFSLKSV